MNLNLIFSRTILEKFLYVITIHSFWRRWISWFGLWNCETNAMVQIKKWIISIWGRNFNKSLSVLKEQLTFLPIRFQKYYHFSSWRFWENEHSDDRKQEKTGDRKSQNKNSKQHFRHFERLIWSECTSGSLFSLFYCHWTIMIESTGFANIKQFF